jgi:hypothetical protein
MGIMNVHHGLLVWPNINLIRTQFMVIFVVLLLVIICMECFCLSVCRIIIMGLRLLNYVSFCKSRVINVFKLRFYLFVFVI